MRALLIVPPFVKSSSGPALGPETLNSAANAAGHDVEVLDLAIAEVHVRCTRASPATASGIAGDHDKDSSALERAEQAFFSDVRLATLAEHLDIDTDSLRNGTLSFEEATAAATALTRSAWGDRIRTELSSLRAPELVGLSVMFSDQVVAAISLSQMARRTWPATPVVWGGAHVAALADEIARDPRYGYAATGFVAGYAEETFVELLVAIANGDPWPGEVFAAGAGGFKRARDDMSVAPAFSDLSDYGLPRLTLPAQVSRGCSYAACAFCTYPAIEGAYRTSAQVGHAAAVVVQAERAGAVVSFKDALLTPLLLRRRSALIQGRVPWAGCTKLSSELAKLIPALAASGCQTLEVGLESVLPTSQSLIQKRQPRELFLRVLDAAASTDLRLVVNYMTGFPGEDPLRARAGLEWVRDVAAHRRARVQHQVFSLERRAPLAQWMRPSRSWPWASVLAWDRTQPVVRQNLSPSAVRSDAAPASQAHAARTR